MLELFGSGVIYLWLEMAKMQIEGRSGVIQTYPIASLSLSPTSPNLTIPDNLDPATANTIKQYLKNLSKKGISPAKQGIWMQSGLAQLANHQGNIPLPAASLTKIATSLAVLETWGPNHQLETMISATGEVKNGVILGDLVVSGGSDPLFLWSDAIAVGNALNRMGIKRVNGNLIIDGSFTMNFEDNPTVAGQLFKQALNYTIWPQEAQEEYKALPPKTPKPKVEITGNVKVISQQQKNIKAISNNLVLTHLLRHQSLPIIELLKEMNVESNNEMAQILADAIGGAKVVKTRSAIAAGVPENEIQLINGSGLGVENRISPRAVCAMLQAIQNYAQPLGLSVADFFPVSGKDKGTIEDRHIPPGSAVKTGTLSVVSALAGVLPTRDRGLIWFAIINGGEDVDGLRQQQDILLQKIWQQTGALKHSPAAITPNPKINNDRLRLEESDRNQLLFGSSS